MKTLAMTRTGRQRAVSERVQQDFEAGETGRTMMAIATSRSWSATLIALLVVFNVADALTGWRVVPIAGVFAAIVVGYLIMPYRVVVVTDQRLLVYRGSVWFAEPGALLLAAPRADVRVLAIHSGWIRPVRLDVAGRKLSFYSTSLAYWLDAKAIGHDLQQNPIAS